MLGEEGEVQRDFLVRHAPLRLALAAKIAFPDGSMTVSGLRREIKRGRLEVERIAGKDYTTLEAIARMREACRSQAAEYIAARSPSSPIVEDTIIYPRLPMKKNFGLSPQEVLRARLKQTHAKKGNIT
jgi:hypothetical protein